MGQITPILSYAWEIILHVNAAEITVQPLDLDFFPEKLNPKLRSFLICILN